MRKILIAILLVSFPAISFAQETQNNDEPPYGMEELQAYAVFMDAYRSGEYDLAMDYGEWMINAKPREIPGHEGFSLERQFERMIDVYIGAAEEENDPSASIRYLKKAESVFDEFFEEFDNGEIDEFAWYMRQGRFYHEHHEAIGASMDDAIASYEKMYEADIVRFAEESDGFFARIVLMHYASQSEVEKANNLIDEIEQYAAADLQSTIDEVRESLFENPEDRITFLESRITGTEGEERIQMLKSLRDLYDETGQTEQAIETGLQLYELNPDYDNTRAIADYYLDDGNYGEALQYLEEAAEYAETDEMRAETALLIAESHQHLRNLQEARNYIQEAAEFSDNPGSAYMRMASLYATAISACTGGSALERHDRAVYWLVLDYLDRAAQADPSLASRAENRAESYVGAMPSSEDKFFSGWETGDSFRIDGSLDQCYAWINETTTVR